jgi:preprotein translocase subunit Sec63
LDVDATEEDIKYRYKKLSLKVHPDRMRHVEKAREAFEEVCMYVYMYLYQHKVFVRVGEECVCEAV